MAFTQLKTLLFTLLCVISASTACAQEPRNETDYVARNLQTIQKIYNLTVYPNNVPIQKNGSSAVPPGLFNPNATGRVSPVGNFSGFADSIEYFFALAPSPQNFNGLAFHAADVVEFTSGCPEVASSVVYLRTHKVDPKTGEVDKSQKTSTLAQVAFWRFDENGAVMYYHAWIPQLQLWIEAATGIDFKNVVIQKAVSTVLCPQIQDRCKGKDQQYTNVATCAAFLNLKPFGSFDEVWGDNVVCRQIHLLLTGVRPDVHCPHVGPKGGSKSAGFKCVDVNYSQDYFDDTKLFEEGVDENGAKSRGGMINSYLTVPPESEETDDEFVQRLLNDVGIHDVGGFTLLFGELRAPKSAGRSDSESLNDSSQSHTSELPGIAIVSNRTESPKELRRIGTRLGETHGLSNSHYGDNSWPKVVNGERFLNEAIFKNTSTDQGQDEFITSLFEILCVDDIPRRTSDESWDKYVRHMRNSIMIPAGKGAVKQQSSSTEPVSGRSDGPLTQVRDEAYGTMKQTVILVSKDGKVVFVERTLYDDDGRPLEVGRQEQRVEFMIEAWKR
ncbi:hypothetical protein TI39_contig4223g00007 [Zymoseptoria brevis]|uniref:Uncharacterized protein n=1 Tax=Zymoseptoria brevis TaxID=1047168 RepID=A0A0F4GCY3_9PEZI|nr:hypothetical protein TI39_contig4223g00007 [Zymoseptoria brevis]